MASKLGLSFCCVLRVVRVSKCATTMSNFAIWISRRHLPECLRLRKQPKQQFSSMGAPFGNMPPCEGPYKTSRGKFCQLSCPMKGPSGWAALVRIWGKPYCIRFCQVLNNRDLLHRNWLPNLQEGPWHSETSDVHRVWVVDIYVEYACKSHTLLLSKELMWVGRQLDIKMCSLR